MRGSDYVIRRVLFAVATVFVAISLNFVLFRTLSGDAVSALRCAHCTQAMKSYQRHQLGLDKSKWEQYLLYLRDLAHGNLGRSLRTEEPVSGMLWEPLKNTMPMVALGTFFSIVLGILTGVISAWRRGTAVDKAGLWSSLAFYSMPPQWLG
ncbi:MAG: ABC transporter permease, partial [Gaiellaceae bacterium]